jgi:D-inositol-3-phosphate glycosyltransferase
LNRKMRIAMLSVHSCPTGPLGTKDTGGMSVYIRELAHEMGARGYTVDIYTRIHDYHDPQQVEVGPNARVIHLRAGPDDTPKRELFKYLPEFIPGLEDFRRGNSLTYDLVFSHYWLSGWVGERLAISWKVPHVVMFHTLGAIKQSLGIGEDEPEQRLQTEAALAQNGYVIAATPRERDFLTKTYNAQNVSVHPCGVNMEMFRPLNKNDSRRQLCLNEPSIVLYVGRIEPLKGIEQLLKAISLISAKPRLVIIGGDGSNSDAMEKLKGLAAGLGIENRVSFLGLVEQKELPLYYSAADVCVVPSYYESFNLVALESLACGTQVVAADVGDLSHIVKQGAGFVLPDNSPEKLADKLEVVLAGTGLAGAEEIRESVRRFAWPKVTAAVLAEFRKILNT